LKKKQKNGHGKNIVENGSENLVNLTKQGYTYYRL